MPKLIAGDWGTTSLRLFLCENGIILDRVTAPGVSDRRQSPRDVFRHAITPWGAHPAMLCGMVGSTLGWVEVPYLPCPTDAPAAAQAATRFEDAGAPIYIMPGLRCINPLGAPDVMRGEETQIFGAMSLRPALASGRHVLVLPGTHTKWVLVEHGRVATFLTTLTGELFAVLRDHSTLGRFADGPEAADPGAFPHGLERVAAHPRASLTQMLFEARSRQLLEGLDRASAMQFLSGLVIGSDVAAGLCQFGLEQKVTLIGEESLTARYSQAVSLHGVETACLPGDACALAGLQAFSATCTEPG